MALWGIYADGLYKDYNGDGVINHEDGGTILTEHHIGDFHVGNGERSDYAISEDINYDGIPDEQDQESCYFSYDW